MVSFYIDLSSLEAFLDKAPAKADAAVRGTLERALAQAADTARATNSFQDRTGNLRRSIGYEIEGDSIFTDGITGTLRATMPYASFIEDGTQGGVRSRRGRDRRGRWKKATSSNHSGILARKFLASAIDPDKVAQDIAEDVVRAWES